MSGKPGTVVWIPSEIGSGVFPAERSIKIHVPAGGGPAIVGFVPREDVQEDRGLVKAVVLESHGDSVAILFRGDMLSGSNPFLVPRLWLDKFSER